MTETAPQKDNNEIVPPSTLSKNERWIVRLHGVDMGPFSSFALYPKLLTGEVDPETMLLDQDRFSRCRLKEIPEFQEYLHLHNTHNPILLEEERQKEREEYWQTTGRKRVIWAISTVVVLITGSIVAWQMLKKSSDVYMAADGDFLFSMPAFKTHKMTKKKGRIWKDVIRRKRSKGKGKAKGKAGAQATASVVDFSAGGGGDAIPRAKINSILKRKIRYVFGCFKSQMERDSNFTGGEIIFTINGGNGRIKKIGMDNTGDTNIRILKRCIRRWSRSWAFPTFSGNAVIHYPIYVQRKETRW